MTNAQDVLDQAHATLAKTEQEIRAHPYLAAIGNGQVSVEALQAFPGHQYHMWRSDLRAAANFVQRFGDRPYRKFFIDDLNAEIAARESLLVFAAKLDMTEDDLSAFEPTNEGFAYAAYFNCLSTTGSAAEVACGLAVNLAAWGYNCGQVSNGLKTHYGFSDDDAAFTDGFASIPSLEQAAAEIIQDDLDRGVQPRQIIRAARLIQGYERMFWDAMLTAAEA